MVKPVNMPFTSQVLKESMRFNPPVPCSDEYKITRDCKLANFELQKDVGFKVNIHWTHRNPSEWHQPDEFHPENFDPEHEKFKTPGGKLRKEWSFNPFNIGERRCIGYMFSLNIMPNLLSKLIKNFDFEFVDKKYDEEHYFPIASLAQNRQLPIEVRLMARDAPDA